MQPGRVRRRQTVKLQSARTPHRGLARTGRGGGAARMTFVGASADLKGFSGASAGADLTDAVKVRAPRPRPERWRRVHPRR